MSAETYRITVKPDGSWSQVGYDHGPRRTVKVIRSFTASNPDGSIKNFFAILRWGGGKEGGLGGSTYPVYYRLVRIIKTNPVNNWKDGVCYNVQTVFEVQPGRKWLAALTYLLRLAAELETV